MTSAVGNETVSTLWRQLLRKIPVIFGLKYIYLVKSEEWNYWMHRYFEDGWERMRKRDWVYMQLFLHCFCAQWHLIWYLRSMQWEKITITIKNWIKIYSNLDKYLSICCFLQFGQWLLDFNENYEGFRIENKTLVF